MTTHTVRFYAGAAEAAGADSASISLAPGAMLADLVAALGAGNPRLAEVLGVCTLLLDGRPAPADSPLPESPALVDVLPPFAGG